MQIRYIPRNGRRHTGFVLYRRSESADNARAGFNEVHYGLWLKTLTDEEFEKIKEVIEEHYK